MIRLENGADAKALCIVESLSTVIFNRFEVHKGKRRVFSSPEKCESPSHAFHTQ